ncbi:metallophosphoesterase [Polyangium mundeleinium]|uniref:Metallophosphoesterase n=1 Tax=Polyangium mundeleinium TaxID=2995306 RepID=A0ABT5EIK5_9BACT|nr:metallophosphoesterase [Polyangium mundeleinium]MDC0741646.1 metallophosphoesterase [Polyangium mundeleinium]
MAAPRQSTQATLGRWRPLVTFLPIGVAVVSGIHYYLWMRLVRDVGFPTSIDHALTVMLVLAAASVPTGVVASRLVSPRWSVWWLAPVYVWIGTAFYLLLAAGIIDLLRLVLELVTFEQPEIERIGPEAGAFLIATCGVGAATLAVLEARTLRVEHVEVPLSKLPRALDGFRIAQISDVHVGPIVGRKFLERVVSKVNDLDADVVVITGDLVDGSVEDLAHDVAPLASLASTFGTFFVTGNHEYHAGAPEWCAHLPTLGVRVLRNEHVVLDRDGHGLDLAGIDDYEATHFDIGHGANLARATAGRDARRPLILLAHQPKAIHEAVRYEVDLQLSGHTHGGQLWPLRWLLRLSDPFVAGLGRLGDTRVYVSRGTGHSGPPMRLGAPAEITHIVLRAT